MFALRPASLIRAAPSVRATPRRVFTKKVHACDDTSPSTFLRALRDVLGDDDADTIERLVRDEPTVTDIVLDAGRAPVVYFGSKEPPCTVSLIPVEPDKVALLWDTAVRVSGNEHLAHLTSRTGVCASRPLDRLSKMHHYDGSISGMTWRVACHDETAVPDALRSTLHEAKHTLLYGPPGSGKTTLLRAVAKHCSETLRERVVVVDATGELGGYHPAGNVLGYFTRRMCVPPGQDHHDTIMEAVRNHTPDTIVVDELVTRHDVAAVVSAAARGVRVIATTHASAMEDVIANPVFRHAVGNIQDATVTDARAKAQNGKKSIRERTTPPTFCHAYAVHTRDMDTDVATTIDRLLN